ncbi:MAG: DUF535 family protein, partial [Novosphingobium sp.]|nr:DUF535 family protein [Novosphingobium sp.]
EQSFAGSHPPLQILLEPASVSPMEGELQLRFCFRTSSLFTLTFSLVPKGILGSTMDAIVIGGVQGGYRCRVEIREAAKLNGEISPAAMLVLAVRALARVLNVTELIAVGEQEQIAMAYASHKIKLDYGQFWLDAGATTVGRVYHVPVDPVEKPLVETPLTHRSRTRRKRERRKALSHAIEQQLALLFLGAPVSTRVIPTMVASFA